MRRCWKQALRMRVAGVDLELTRPVQHRYVDRVYGELVRPLAIVPPVAVSLDQPSLVFPDGKPKHVDVQVKSNASKQAGDVRLELPAGWKADPPMRHFELTSTDEQTSVAFDLTPPATATVGKVKAVADVGDRQVGVGIELITYPHIPVQTLFPPAESTLVRADVKTLSKKIGYVMGAGDDVPEALRQIGCDVTLLTSEDLSRGDLTKFDAVVTGVRAWNLRPDLRANYQRLYDYAQKGGTVVVQYNTPEGGQGPGPTGAPPTESSILAHIGPYPIQLSRNDRVTVEEAPCGFPQSEDFPLASGRRTRSRRRISTAGFKSVDCISPTSGMQSIRQCSRVTIRARCRCRAGCCLRGSARARMCSPLIRGSGNCPRECRGLIGFSPIF